MSEAKEITEAQSLASSTPPAWPGRLHAQFLLPASGLVVTLLLWWLATQPGLGASAMAARFSPAATWEAIATLANTRELWPHTVDSLRRVIVGLALALGVGVPIGLLVGVSCAFERSTTATFQFLRMISPLSWMPLAVMALGIGDAPVYFLLAFAAVWPIALNVAAGVQAIDPRWLRLARSLAARRLEVLIGIIIPAIVSHLLTGVRLAIGLIWVVLVPAEMLGVHAGLGYFILDTRDRMAYGELMAVILFIGMLGYLLDLAARLAHRAWDRRD
ncbi:ABC transporter permease [Thiocapsa rosea]|uniref:NitT/TauT family transport system permease protein n=1 Tax=Thiocapsa rosea TaxID=69360 RepID=A0A495VF01_9GAMM|nr:ABC transporter permease [Thiocapsa rosea]RKT47173.1 NitT/TauT family transport system permease protein [Thiocapsa rosea]